MGKAAKLQRFSARLVMLGFGCIGQGVLPLLLRHLDLKPRQLLIISPDHWGEDLAHKHGIAVLHVELTPHNYRQVLGERLASGDFLLNLSVDVSSLALIQLCRERGALYLDTCIEPWPGGYDDPRLSLSERSNYALREAVLALRRPGAPGPTAVITHGANPGLISHLLKQALLELAADGERDVPVPATRKDWARLARTLGIRSIHIAERDSQYALTPKAMGEFVNTWSVPGFLSEACQPAELGWGSHEREMPDDGSRHASGCQAAIYLNRPGAATQVHSWTPVGGAQLGFLVTHGESISIADYFTLGHADAPDYRPTVLYAYHPCDAAVLSLHELAGRNWRPQRRQRLLENDIVDGVDALGVLLMGHPRGVYWYGSRLSIQQARALCPQNNATSLQVTAAVMAGVVWAIRHPDRGIVEPDEIPHDQILPLCLPYLGEVSGVYSDWTPLKARRGLFPEDLDLDDPWQLKNFRAR